MTTTHCSVVRQVLSVCCILSLLTEASIGQAEKDDQKILDLLNRIANGLENVKPGSNVESRDRSKDTGYRALYNMNADGTGAEFLFSAPGRLSTATPEWSHDGTMVAYDSVPDADALREGRIGVYAVSGPFKGMSKDLGYGNVPTWSPDDKQIAFLLNDGNPLGAPGGVWVMNSDGSNRRWLCNGSYPRWSPDGKEICCRAFAETPPELHFYNVETGAIRKTLGGDVGVEFGGGTWSHDGKRVWFIALFDGHQHVASISADGSPDSLKVIYTEQDKKRLLVGPPVESPDGQRIVLAIQDDAETRKPRLWVNTYIHWLPTKEGGSPTLLEPHKIGLINRGMMWSRDGKKLTFSSER